MVVFSLGRWSSHIQSRFLVSRPTRIIPILISLTGLSPSMAPLSRGFCYRYKYFRAIPISLAATLGISIDFFSSGYWDVSLRQVRSPKGDMTYAIPGCPIRKFMYQSLLTAPHDLSQSSTSFIASISLGIHRTPLKAYIIRSLDLTSVPFWHGLLKLTSLFNIYIIILILKNWTSPILGLQQTAHTINRLSIFN